MAVTWVAGTGVTLSSGGVTDVSASSPAGLADGDGLYAFVGSSLNNSSFLTGPAGWTKIVGTEVSGTGGQTCFAVFAKDAVTSGNSSTSYTFSASFAGDMTLHYAAVRGGGGVVAVDSYVTGVLSNNATPSLAPPAATAPAAGTMMVVGIGAFLDGTASTAAPTFPTGMTGWTSTASPYCSSAGAYQARNSGEAVSTDTFDFATPSGGSGHNYLAAITLVVTEGLVPIEDEITDTIGSGEALTFTPVYGALAADTIGGHDTVGYFPRYGAAISDILRCAQVLAAAYRGYPVASDVIQAQDALRRAYGDVLTQGVGILPAQAVTQGVALIQALALTETLSTNQKLALTLLQEVALSDALQRFFSGVVEEGVGVLPSLLTSWRPPVTVSEGVGVAETLGCAAVFKVTTADTVEVTPALLLQALFSPTVLEGVEISAAYIQPSGSVTTWAVNTRTNATTEYTNFDFNSFARMGRRYIAASSEGLYVLDGDDDDGTDVISAVRTGLAQFAGSRFSSLKAAYLGLRGEGEFILKVIEGDGTERAYSARVADMRTAKVQTGKGLRSTYFAFELISTGQDFDLDKIEMVPILNQRRV